MPSSQERASRAQRILPLEREEIHGLEIEWQGNRVVLSADRGDDSNPDWRLVMPFDAPADNDQVEQLIDALVELEKKRSLDDVDRSEAGLEPPRLTAVISTGAGEWELQVGGPVPVGDTMIVSVDGGEPHVVDDLVWVDLTREPGDWRRRSVYSGERAAIRALSLSGPQGIVELVAEGDRFRIASPIADLADPAKVDRLLAALFGLRIQEFVDEPIASVGGGMGIETTSSWIEVVADDHPKPFRVLWGEPVSERPERHYAAAAEQVFETDSNLGELLDTDAEEWRSRALTTLETFEIDSLEIAEQGAETLDLTRAGADWRLGNETVSFPTVSELLYAIRDLKAVGFRDGAVVAGPGDDVGFPVIEVSMAGASRRESIVLRPAAGNVVSAEVEGRAVQLEIARDQFTELRDKIAAVRSAASVKNPEDEKVRVDEIEISSDEQ